MTAPLIVIDHERQPTEESLEAWKAWADTASVEDQARWLATELPELARALFYATCRVERSEEDRETVTVSFATGGWSGAEMLIETVLSVRMLRFLFYSAWHRGGLHEFEFDSSFLNEKET